MALIFLLRGVVLLANGRVALSIDAARGSVSDDSRNLADVVPDFGSVVEVAGWGIFIPANLISPSTINLGVAANGRACLSKCVTREIPGCRLVSFDLNTRVCTGWNQHMEGTFVPNAGNTLLAISAKQFQQRSGVYFAGTLIHGQSDITMWVSGTNSLFVKPSTLMILGNGDLALLNSDGEIVWKLGTAGEKFAGASLSVMEDGTLCLAITTPCLWSTPSQATTCQQDGWIQRLTAYRLRLLDRFASLQQKWDLISLPLNFQNFATLPL
ncbi:hypothetical protein BV898_18691 [Hypsibius exemplaris]|uniref:Bulb-type lectin domain-containing protein n=1 Tax=Hypsibius exemplaris TaxID=2072580 RepID=A0A9X6NHQ9_HYPEX|nr:hypothetical protein BV898_18691 [Hypsibius exemplaris]